MTSRHQRRQDHPTKSLPAAGSEQECGFFHVGIEAFQHRLHRAHDERQAEKGQHQHHGQPRIGRLEFPRAPEIAPASPARRTGSNRRAPPRRSARRTANRSGRSKIRFTETRSAPAPRPRAIPAKISITAEMTAAPKVNAYAATARSGSTRRPKTRSGDSDNAFSQAGRQRNQHHRLKYTSV